MNKLFLVIQREYTTRVKKKSFIILTVTMPFLIALIGFVPFWLATIKDDNQKQVAVSDATGHYISLFRSNATYRFVPVADPDNNQYYTSDSPYEAVVNIRADLTQNPKGVTIYSRKEVSAGLQGYVEGLLNEQVRRDKIKATGIEGIDRILDDVQTHLNVPTAKRDAEGSSTSSSTTIAMGAGFLFMFLIYMFVLSYGGMVMASVTEEKTNRIVELIVSSVKPFQLMMGKIIGIALVGFTQMCIWAVMLTVIFTAASSLLGLSPEAMQQASSATSAGAMGVGVDAAMQVADTGTQEILSALFNLPYLEIFLFFVLYFIGGYLLYASFFAGVGASANEPEDSSQFMMPVVLVMLFGLYAAMGSIENTDGPLAFWTSMFPLTSPIVMMERIPFGVPLWEELLSVGLLYATALFFVWFSARIYRVGILMYGKKPTLKEMLRWMRYK